MDFVKNVMLYMMISSGYKSRMMNTSVARQHYLDIPGTGKLPPVVVIHGIGTGNSSYFQMFNHLRKYTKRIVAPEAPGHGYSDPPIVPLTPEALFEGHAEIINSQLREPFFIFGNSLGGAMAIEYSLRYPEKVLGLILSSPAGAYLADEDLKEFLNTFRITNTKEAINFINALTDKRMPFSWMVSNDVIKMFKNEWINTFLNSLTSDYYFKPEQLSELKMPVQFIWGKSEKVMLDKHLNYYKEHLPKHSIIDEPDNFGHCPYLDRPKQLADKMVEFMENVITTKYNTV